MAGRPVPGPQWDRDIQQSTVRIPSPKNAPSWWKSGPIFPLVVRRRTHLFAIITGRSLKYSSIARLVPVSVKTSTRSHNAVGTSTARMNPSWPNPSALARPTAKGTYQGATDSSGSPARSRSRVPSKARSMWSRNRATSDVVDQAVHAQAAVVHDRTAEYRAGQLVRRDLGKSVHTREGVGEIRGPRRPAGGEIEVGKGRVAELDDPSFAVGIGVQPVRAGQLVDQLERRTVPTVMPRPSVVLTCASVFRGRRGEPGRLRCRGALVKRWDGP